MPTEKLEKYRALYSKYIEESVYLHNMFVWYMERDRFDDGALFRQAIRRMIKLQKELYKASKELREEKKLNKKLAREQLELEKAQRKAAREQKNGRNNKSIKSNV